MKPFFIHLCLLCQRRHGTYQIVFKVLSDSDIAFSMSALKRNLNHFMLFVVNYLMEGLSHPLT